MKKLRLCALSLLTAAALLLPALPARAEGLEVTAPSAVLPLRAALRKSIANRCTLDLLMS